MTPVVIDASAGVELVVDTARGRALRALLPIDAVPWAPDIFYVEVGTFSADGTSAASSRRRRSAKPFTTSGPGR